MDTINFTDIDSQVSDDEDDEESKEGHDQIDKVPYVDHVLTYPDETKQVDSSRLIIEKQIQDHVQRSRKNTKMGEDKDEPTEDAGQGGFQISFARNQPHAKVHHRL